jgi:sugar lactone lactonase YvrE
MKLTNYLPGREESSRVDKPQRIPGSKKLFIVITLLLFAALACSLPFAARPEPKTGETVLLPEPEDASPPTPQPAPTALDLPEPDDDLIRQGAARSYLDPYAVDDIGTGQYQSDDGYCGEPSLAGLPEEGGEIILALSYSSPLLLERIEIYKSGQPDGIRRIELLNSTSGLGQIIYESGQNIQRQALTVGPCQERLNFSVQDEFEADTIFVSFENLAAASQIRSVEMLGRLNAFAEPPVFWRIPLDSYPISLAVNNMGMIYLAANPNDSASYDDQSQDELHAYDIEGNHLNQFSVPSNTRLTDVAADAFGNLVVVDAGFGWFILVSPEGEHLTIGGDELSGLVAVSPQDGNIYILGSSAIRVYTSDTGELLREMPFNEVGDSYVGLAFDPDGYLYTVRYWDAVMLKLDPLTGDELDAIPLQYSANVDVEPHDLAIDASKNFYVLFATNVSEVAVHVLGPDGTLLRRFGKLDYEPQDRPEGSFFEPTSIGVSPDGRFIIIADGIQGDYSLTAFLVEPGE